MSVRRRHRGARGQMVVVSALMALLIFGALALGVDLGVQTVSQRSLQNVSDAGALAGATDLGAQVTSAQQQAAIADALSTVQRNLGGTWAGGTPSPSVYGTLGSFSAYRAAGTDVVGGSDYTVTVSTPPQTPRSSTNETVNDLEVDLTTSVHNGFASVLGVPISSVAAHAVAYHWGPPQGYLYTFFTEQIVESGNYQETIEGNAYVGSGYEAQSSGQAGLCVFYPPGTTADGHMVYGVYPPTVGGEPEYGYTGGTTPPTTATPTCPGSGALTAEAPSPQAGSPSNCPYGATAVQDPNTLVWGCVDANPPVPQISGAACGPGVSGPTPTAITQSPWYDPLSTVTCAALTGSQTINASSSAGIYVVPAGATATLDFSKGSINCVSLELDAGASVTVTNKKLGNYITSYGWSYPDSTATGEMSSIGTTPPTQGCPGAGIPADTCVVCAAATTTTPMPTALGNYSTGCCSDTLFVGTVFVPGQEIFFNTNQAMEDVGSVYCGTWDVQSGNHPNPMIRYAPSDTTPEQEQLRLVE